MQSKILSYLLLPILGSLIAGIYGVLHDQITYTIAPEYYTRFKYIQFQISEHLHNRIGVSIVGFAATWWVGLFLGIVFSAVGFIQPTAQRMRQVTIKCIVWTIFIVACMGGVGYFIGRFAMDAYNPSYYFPPGVQDKQNFLAVGMIHNLGYLGGLIGLVVGIIIKKRTKNKEH